MLVSRTRSLAALLGLALLGNGCDGPTRPPPSGTITVVIDGEGADVQQVGYRSAVDNGTPRTVDTPGLPTTFTNIEPGTHTVRLEGLAPNCVVMGQNPVTVHVVTNQTAVARFVVSCRELAGTVRVTTVTTGGDPDPSGYVAMVNGALRGAVGVNATVAIPVRVGTHVISLGDVSPNCGVAAPSLVNVNVAFQDTVDVAFDIQCVSSGTLEVTVATTGADLDPDGYRIDVHAASVGFGGSHTVAPNGSATFVTLRPAADYRVTPQDVARNCDVVGADAQAVTVIAGGTTTVTFDVACSPVPRLAFVRDHDIYTMAVNGTFTAQLTTDRAINDNPAWSSTGRIAFTTQRHGDDAELYVMNDDGTNPVRITTSARADDAPSWSPDGSRIVFWSSRDRNAEIYVVNADGTGATRLTNNTFADFQPAWSSTGKIAFVSDREGSPAEIYVMNEDGSNVVRLTNNTDDERSPAWSPDGSMIAFTRASYCYYYYQCGWDLFVMDADGSNERRLATGVGNTLQATDPSWSPDGRSIAFTQALCPHYCSPSSVRIVDLYGARLDLVTDDGANPVWKP